MGSIIMQGQPIGVIGDRGCENNRAVIDPYRLIVLRVLETTRNDIRSGKRVRVRFGRRFIKSSWFEMMCDGCGLNPDYVREVIGRKQNGSKKS